MDKTDPKPLTAISAAINEKNLDDALWTTLKLYLHEIRYTESNSKDMKMVLRDFSKILLEMKRTLVDSDEDKQRLLEEILEYIDESKDQ